jgi:hypothetical protein
MFILSTITGTIGYCLLCVGCGERTEGLLPLRKGLRWMIATDGTADINAQSAAQSFPILFSSDRGWLFCCLLPLVAIVFLVVQNKNIIYQLEKHAFPAEPLEIKKNP